MATDTLIKLRGNPYRRDAYGNVHQVISDEAYGKLLEFYRDHVYFAGSFRPRSFFQKDHSGYFGFLKREIHKAKRQARLFSDLVAPLHTIDSLLELGCGIGGFLREAVRQGVPRVLGWDLSKDAGKIGKQLWKDERLAFEIVEVLDGLLSDTALPKWNAVVAFDLVEHVRDDVALLNAMKALLSSGGVCLIQVPVFQTEGIETLENAEYLYPEHHLHLYSLEGFQQTAKACGWSLRDRSLQKGGKKATYILELP